MSLDVAIHKMREKDGLPDYEGNRRLLAYYDRFAPLNTLRDSLPDFVTNSIEEWSG